MATVGNLDINLNGRSGVLALSDELEHSESEESKGDGDCGEFWHLIVL